MADSIIRCKDWMKADVVLVGANYDNTSSFGKGACNGPWAITQCLDRQIEFFEPITQTSPAESTNIAYWNLGELNYHISEYPPRLPLATKPEVMVKTVQDTYLDIF